MFPNHGSATTLATGGTVILLHPPLSSAAVSIGMEREGQPNDSLADGCHHRHNARLGPAEVAPVPRPDRHRLTQPAQRVFFM